MNKSRFEAFSDGVLAIIITIMVLELKVPNGTDWNAIKSILPSFGSYLLSFVFIGIYWGNHHHLIHTLHKVNGTIIWANLHLLFWLSLIPFGTRWMAESNFDQVAVAMYGALLVACGFGYGMLSGIIARTPSTEPDLSQILQKSNFKKTVSYILYL